MALNEDFEFQIYLKSKTGISQNNTPAWVTFDLSTRPIIVPDEYRISLCVSDCCLKNTWTNINTYNNTIVVQFTWVVGLVTTITYETYTITPGIYTVYSLATQLETDMTDWTVTYDSNEAKFTFVYGGADQTSFTWYTGTTADDLLGVDFTLSTAALTSTDLSYTGTLVADLTYSSYVYITSPELTNLSRDTYAITSVSDVLAAVQITCNSTGIVFYKGTSRTILNKTLISSISIILKDENNNILPLQGGWWNLTLDITIVPIKFLMDAKTQLRLMEIEQNGAPKPSEHMIPVESNKILKPLLNIKNINKKQKI